MLKNNAMAFSDREFHDISKMADDRYGILIPPNKKNLLHARIAKRMRMLGVDSFQSYMSQVEQQGSAGEKENFLNLLTTNTTSFFRENHHFKFLTENVLPEFQSQSGSGSLNIWSAGCSFGQEPYSISAVVNSFKRKGGIQASITATDVDHIVLNRAKSGIYRQAELLGLTSEQKESLFGIDETDQNSISQNNRELVNFQVLNLMDKLSPIERYDVVFCRNVVIYFTRETQQKIWSKFLQVIKPGGYLFLGHSERLTGPILSEFESVGLTIYRRRINTNKVGG